MPPNSISVSHNRNSNINRGTNRSTIRNHNKHKNINKTYKNVQNKYNKYRTIPGFDESVVLALDCEMVGVGPSKQSALAEIAIVNFDGDTIYHTYVKPQQRITDFRTEVSGITPEKIRKGIPFKEAQKQVLQIIRGKYIIGHGLENDFRALQIPIKNYNTFDTTKIETFMRKTPTGFQPRKLKNITKNFLEQTIQTGEHDPAEDARAAMMLFRYSVDSAIQKMTSNST
jgi:RNA exonuclease 4